MAAASRLLESLFSLLSRWVQEQCDANPADRDGHERRAPDAAFRPAYPTLCHANSSELLWLSTALQHLLALTAWLADPGQVLLGKDALVLPCGYDGLRHAQYCT